MSTIDFKQPKYVLPVIALPFLVLFFYVYQSSIKPGDASVTKPNGINNTVGEVSDEVKKKALTDKLEAYRNTYKEADGNTALSPVPVEQPDTSSKAGRYAAGQKRMLDSIDGAMQRRFKSLPAERLPSADQRAMTDALNHVRQQEKETPPPPVVKEKDPMELFRQQMAVMDSLTKANDPEARAEAKRREAAEISARQKAAAPALKVTKTTVGSTGFNTVRPAKEQAMIQAVIDENLTGYAGSRVRLRLLEDIEAGGSRIPRGTYLYALINGFSGQRVTLEVRSVFLQGKILPVRLDVYDLDGLPGLYVPESAFRDFTKDLGTNTIQGVNVDGSSSFVMSTVRKLFESTSSAIAGMIRKNKVKLKYNSYIYLNNNNQ